MTLPLRITPAIVYATCLLAGSILYAPPSTGFTHTHTHCIATHLYLLLGHHTRHLLTTSCLTGTPPHHTCYLSHTLPPPAPLHYLHLEEVIDFCLRHAFSDAHTRWLPRWRALKRLHALPPRTSRIPALTRSRVLRTRTCLSPLRHTAFHHAHRTWHYARFYINALARLLAPRWWLRDTAHATHAAHGEGNAVGRWHCTVVDGR